MVVWAKEAFWANHTPATRKLTCPSCGQPAERVFDTYGIKLVGSGYYNTDQRGSGSHGSSK